MENTNPSPTFTVKLKSIPTWYWQSDPDPWKEDDPKKWNWTPYPAPISAKIENAYHHRQKTVDLGDYEID